VRAIVLGGASAAFGSGGLALMTAIDRHVPTVSQATAFFL
jgi:hypothetical protein